MKKPYWKVLFLTAAVIFLNFGCETNTAKDGKLRTVSKDQQLNHNKILAGSILIQIPGPNPIITPGPEGSWDDKILEAADAFEDEGMYYFYYHACGAGKGYRLGVASSEHPLGPFKKYGDKPILDTGPRGSWDSEAVACAMVVRAEDEEDNTYYMWYSGVGSSPEHKGWCVGLATAKHPLGPWKKYEGNPVLDDFGYVGGVVKINGKYRIYSAHPISGQSHSLYYHSDYSPVAVAIGEKPEGPFKKYKGNPLMVKGSPGDWDDGGISEAEVLYNNGMFHMFYGGTRSYGPRLESIGYAYSFDGFKWYKYGLNPVASRQANPNAAAFAEVHAIIELPFIYLYHTLRPERYEGERNPWIENLGVQVLVTQRPFNFDMPVLRIDSLGAGQKTKLSDSPMISFGNVTKASLTLECSYARSATKPILLHIRGSSDGVNYDTSGSAVSAKGFQPGRHCIKTFTLDASVRFIKVSVENPDSFDMKDISVTAGLGG